MAQSYKIFPDQAYVDSLNVQLPQGISFQVHLENGDLVMNSKAVDSVLKHTTIDPADITLIENLPETTIDEQQDLDETRLTAIEDRLDLIENRLNDLENP